MSGLSKVVVRRSKKLRRCERCGAVIEPGQRYALHTLAPNHPDVGNETWWVSPECQSCAEKCGRGNLFEEQR